MELGTAGICRCGSARRRVTGRGGMARVRAALPRLHSEAYRSRVRAALPDRRAGRGERAGNAGAALLGARAPGAAWAAAPGPLAVCKGMHSVCGAPGGGRLGPRRAGGGPA